MSALEELHCAVTEPCQPGYPFIFIYSEDKIYTKVKVAIWLSYQESKGQKVWWITIGTITKRCISQLLLLANYLAIGNVPAWICIHLLVLGYGVIGHCSGQYFGCSCDYNCVCVCVCVCYYGSSWLTMNIMWWLLMNNNQLIVIIMWLCFITMIRDPFTLLQLLCTGF